MPERKICCPLDKLYMDLNWCFISVLIQMGLLAASRIGDVIRKGPFDGIGICSARSRCTWRIFRMGVWAISWRYHGTRGIICKCLLHLLRLPPCVSQYPQRDPAMWVGLSLGITFPLDIFVGVPIYWEVANFSMEYKSSLSLDPVR